MKKIIVLVLAVCALSVSAQQDVDVTGNLKVNGIAGFGSAPNNAVQTLIKSNNNRVSLCVLTSDNDFGYGVKAISGNPLHKAFAVNTAASGGSDVFRVMGDGTVWATGVWVKNKSQFPDYVFSNGYKLLSFEDLRQFIADNNRLPNIPSADKVKENGVDLGELQRLQMEKIEELTLYILQLEKRIKELENTNK